MLRKCTDENISDEECKKVIDPFYNNFDEYVVTYVILHFILLVLFIVMQCGKQRFINTIILLKIYLILVMMKTMLKLKLK